MARAASGPEKSKPGYFPNDDHMRGLDRKLRRELPPSDGNPRQVPSTFNQQGMGITPEGLSPSGTKTGPAGTFYGLSHNEGKGP